MTEGSTSSDAAAARGRFARHLLARLGAPEDAVAQAIVDAESEAGFFEDLANDLVRLGSYTPSRLPDRRVFVENLRGAPLPRAFATALDRRRGRPASGVEMLRLGRLYDVLGDIEKAASCFREAFLDDSPPPLALTLELAEVAARAGDVSLALGAVDRVAEIVLTGDGESEKRGREGAREDPAAIGASLERARDAALAASAPPRAAALARAAVLVYERSGLKAAATRALHGLATALAAGGDVVGARSALERRRSLAAILGDARGSADSTALLAELAADEGDIEEACALREQEIDFLTSAGEKELAADAAFELARLREQRGELRRACDALARACAFAASAGAGAREAAARRRAARLHTAAGELPTALSQAEAAERGGADRVDRAGEAEALLELAAAHLAGGDAASALQALGRARDEVASGDGAARSLEVHGELAASAGRADDARALLTGAARAHQDGGRLLEAARALLRAAELALASSDTQGARVLLARARALGVVSAPEIEGRAALCDAALAGDAEARGKALDAAFDAAFATEIADLRVAAGLARARHRLDAGLVPLATTDLCAALQSVRDVVLALPEARRPAYLGSASLRGLAETANAAREKLTAGSDAPPPDADETKGKLDVGTTLEVLLAKIAFPAPS